MKKIMNHFLDLFSPHLLFRLLSLILFGGLFSRSNGAFLGSIPLSAQGSFTITYLPQFIGFTATSVPTNFQIEMNGEPMLFSLDDPGLTSMTHIRQNSRISNTYVFQLADGMVSGRNCVFTVTNAQAAVLNIYGWSPIKEGFNFYEYSRLTTLAGATSSISDFAYLAFPGASATDRWQVSYNDGSVDNLIREELNYDLGYYQGDTSGRYNIDNINPARIKKVYFTPTAQQTYYRMTYRQIKSVS